jgi:hypothetical protein
MLRSRLLKARPTAGAFLLRAKTTAEYVTVAVNVSLKFGNSPFRIDAVFDREGRDHAIVKHASSVHLRQRPSDSHDDD